MSNEKKYGRLRHIEDREKYLEIKDVEEGYAWGMKYYSAWADKYKYTMRLAQQIIDDSYCTSPLELYCGYAYRKINTLLRADKGDINDECAIYKEMADILSMVLCSAPRIPCDLILYRIVNDIAIEKLISDNRKYGMMKEKGFMSTSLLKTIVEQKEPYAKEKNLLKIYAEKGTIGVYVNSVEGRNEEEMLLCPQLYLGLSSYPYFDEETKKTIYECKLLNLHIRV